jgi:hypothetical protein
LGRIIPYITENNKCLKPPTSIVKRMKITSGKWLNNRPWGGKKNFTGQSRNRGNKPPKRNDLHRP